jgi:flavin reductase (DIM6/NTAB) family NADH-FMN oxidoreductase RutF
VQQEIAALFRRLTRGVYVVGVAQGDRRNAFTAAWVMQVSFQPPLLALAIHPEHASYPLLLAGGAFAISVLQRGQLDLARAFGTRSGREADKLAGVRWRAAGTGAPVLEESVAFFDCRVSSRHPAGDHELVIGRVVDGAVLRPDAAPMLYIETGDLDGSEGLYPETIGEWTDGRMGG